MSDFYNYIVNFDNAYGGEKISGIGDVLVVFVSGVGFDIQSFIDNVRAEFRRSIFCRNMVVVSAGYNKDCIVDGFLGDSFNLKKVKDAISSLQELNVYGMFYSEDGDITNFENIDNFESSISNFDRSYERIVETGIHKIVKDRNLIMESSENYHFVKPSGKHSNKFIKVTNILENSPEISFLAMNLLKYTSDKLEKIYVDTAGIFPIAYELSLIKKRFEGNGDMYCFIDTYGSYGRVDDYPFRGNSETLVLISASTSDDLRGRLGSNPNLGQAKILSLFSQGVKCKSDSFVSLTEYSRKFSDKYLDDIQTYKSHECILCIKEKSVPLSLTKNQFVFEAPSSETYLPIATDSDASLRRMISHYKSTKAFRCYYDGLDGKSEPVPDYFIDVSKLIKENEYYKERVNNVVSRKFSVASNLIVYCNDVGARDLAVYIRNQVSNVNDGIKIVDSLELSSLIGSEGYSANDITGVVVVAASIQTGKSLLDISRTLRELNEVPITYFVGFCKYNDDNSYNKLKMDLRFCKNKYGFHEFVEVEKIRLPINEYRKTYYSKELEFLKQINSDSDEVSKRISYLKEVTSTSRQGACDEIFLKSPNGKSLVLGKTFAFWNEKDSSDGFSDHAPVLFTISSVLQKLRYETNGRAPLKSGYIIRQLDPLLFDRFNEGIIQASMLRSAKPRELDYSASDESSKIVGTLIQRMMSQPSEKHAEALPEFLLALCLNQLQVKKDHINFFTSFDEQRLVKYPLVYSFVKYIKAIYFDVEEEEDSPIPF